ncbi:phloretin 4'-O-glucosyltransferase-like [Mercurialis annua]|uniref:phloretin 4'-O-glucosyltransferase-like n=1 Tax=Mercurialis annua TaxID=3986 RepID=UPI00215DDA8F|nr:phloretin 4'-O-glucosyltransferase-like [Mercurialis annua]
MVQSESHFLLVTFPSQGHINPSLQFAKRLIRIGARVTLLTCVSATRRMTTASFPESLTLATFSDGYDDGIKLGDDLTMHLSELKRRGSETVNELIISRAKEGQPFTCLVHTLLLSWAAEVARAHHLPWRLLWIQPATVLAIFYYYFNGFGDEFGKCSDPDYEVQLPGGFIPLVSRDIPSFLLPSNTQTAFLSTFQEQIEFISKENNIKILVNTFDALESEELKAIDKFNLVGIGPLLPSAYLDGKDPSDTTFGGDLFRKSKEYTEWLDSKSESSVVYISFGSYFVLSKKQTEEIGTSLLSSNREFFWVIRENPNELISCREELEEKGIMIVPWCNQVEVLSHPSVGCFVTHCGWNSTMEGLVCGVPMVAFPQWSDQGTNTKLIEDVWKSGVRGARNEEGIVESGEIKRCLELVMGDDEKGEEIRKNAEKWKLLARDAVKEGGSSDINLKAFVDEVNGLIDVCSNT